MDVQGARAARSKAYTALRNRKCCLYLDTNWWIRMRKARFSAQGDDEERELLDLMQRLVNENVLTCPASGVVIEEVLRQTDMQSRLSTAFMMDALSGGIALASKEQQAVYEVSSWLHESLGIAPGVPPPSESILTCPAYTIMTPSIAITRGPKALRRAIPLVCDMLYSQMLHVEVMMEWEEWREDPNEPQDVAASMNLVRKGTAADRKQFFQDESAAYLRMHWPRLCRASGSRDECYRGVSLNQALEHLAKGLDSLHPKAMPALQIASSCLAAVRADSGRKFKKGDRRDFDHAGMALPYADAFLTERHLAHILSTRPVDQARRYSCKVLSSAKEAIKYLQSIGASPASSADHMKKSAESKARRGSEEHAHNSGAEQLERRPEGAD